MSYQLVFSELTDEKSKDVGENVFLDNLPSDCTVYLFYYPGAIVDEVLESKLRSLGGITGKNLFVNIGRLNDPNYNKIANKFKIMDLPVIILTAIDDLASPPKEFLTAYVRIDNKKLLNSPDVVIQCLQRLFNLFIEGKISEALNQFEKDKRDIILSRIKGIITVALKGVWEALKDTDVSLSLAEGKFEIKLSGR